MRQLSIIPNSDGGSQRNNSDVIVERDFRITRDGWMSRILHCSLLCVSMWLDAHSSRASVISSGCEWQITRDQSLVIAERDTRLKKKAECDIWLS